MRARRSRLPQSPHARQNPTRRTMITTAPRSATRTPRRPVMHEGLAPVAARHTRLLVLGSFPGVASLQAAQYYAHPRNHFWPILGALWRIELAALPYAARLAELRRRGLGLWDVYARCRREGSLDSAIEDAVPNDLTGLAARLPALRAIAHNGGESARAMRVTRTLGLPVVRLPSTSPANASWSFERKLDAWRTVFIEHGLA
jgi:hypoxanthine-DNA glycosylase